MSGPPPFCRSPLHGMMTGECPEHPKDPTAVLGEVFFFLIRQPGPTMVSTAV